VAAASRENSGNTRLRTNRTRNKRSGTDRKHNCASSSKNIEKPPEGTKRSCPNSVMIRPSSSYIESSSVDTSIGLLT
jgi:hypothetical protein